MLYKVHIYITLDAEHQFEYICILLYVLYGTYNIMHKINIMQ